LLRYAWVAPATLVGAAAGALACAAGARVRIVDGVCEVGGGGLARVAAAVPPRLRFDAITLGHVVIGLDAEALSACRAHERVHVRQYERWGLLFFPLYLGASLASWVAGGHPYRDNVFERDAYRRARPAARPGLPPTRVC
jgi:hypothetical protein